MTTDGRYASFTWLAICLFGFATFFFLSQVKGLADQEWLFMTSIYESTVVLNQAIFDPSGNLQNVPGLTEEMKKYADAIKPGYSATLALGYLTAISVFCLAIVWRRISAPMRI